MKLIIQIPCYNEEATLPITLKELPQQVDGFNKVEWLIIDDGSTDQTVKAAQSNGVEHVVSLSKHRGLAKSFMVGINSCLKLGADIIVNTDADNQYYSGDIPKLVKPIIDKNADIVIGARSIDSIRHFSTIKKMLQKIGSWVVRLVSKTDIPDTTSGFRALSRDAALRLNIFNEYTYTLEMIIQAGQKKMTIASVPIRTNAVLRPSRLIKNIPSYVKNSIITIVRIFVVYKPFRFFMFCGTTLFSCGILIGIRFLYHYFLYGGEGYIQSLILASILVGIGFQIMMVAFLSDLQSVNRRLMEDIQYRLKKNMNINQ